MPKLHIKDNLGLMIVDGDYLFYRAHFAYSVYHGPQGALKTSTGLDSGAFYGFFSMLLRKIETYSPKQIIICWGDKRSNLERRKLFSSYKESRVSMSSDFFSQLLDVKEALFLMNIEQYLNIGYEADDIIATFAHKFEQDKKLNDSEMCMIVSNDKDLLQLVTDKIFVTSSSSGRVKGDVIYTVEKVVEKFGVPPNILADYLSLVGDNSDGIPGVDGVGPRTAVKLLLENGPIKNWIGRLSDVNIKDSIKNKISQSLQQLVINKKLISLKSVNLIPILVEFKDSLSYKSASEVFDKYEMRKIRPESILIVKRG